MQQEVERGHNWVTEGKTTSARRTCIKHSKWQQPDRRSNLLGDDIEQGRKHGEKTTTQLKLRGWNDGSPAYRMKSAKG